MLRVLRMRRGELLTAIEARVSARYRRSLAVGTVRVLGVFKIALKHSSYSVVVRISQRFKRAERHAPLYIICTEQRLEAGTRIASFPVTSIDWRGYVRPADFPAGWVCRIDFDAAPDVLTRIAAKPRRTPQAPEVRADD